MAIGSRISKPSALDQMSAQIEAMGPGGGGGMDAYGNPLTAAPTPTSMPMQMPYSSIAPPSYPSAAVQAQALRRAPQSSSSTTRLLGDLTGSGGAGMQIGYQMFGLGAPMTGRRR